MKLPSSLTTVTPFSKIVALLLFIALPILAFIIGYNHAQKVIKTTTTESQRDIVIKKETETLNVYPTSIPYFSVETSSWKTYKSLQYNYSFKYPANYVLIEEYADPQGVPGKYWVNIKSRVDIPVYDATQEDLEVSIAVEPATASATLDSITNDTANNQPYERQFNLVKTYINNIPAVRYRTLGPGGLSKTKKVGDTYVEGDSTAEIIKLLYQNREFTIIKSPAESFRQNEFEAIISSLIL